ncbi:MAG: hypothetical protein ABR875_03970 [Minisyncoccia bacterium]|jgi:hypothetical protein
MKYFGEVILAVFAFISLKIAGYCADHAMWGDCIMSGLDTLIATALLASLLIIRAIRGK